MADRKELHYADYIVFVCVLVLSMGVGLYYAMTGGKQRTTSEFLMGDRTLKVGCCKNNKIQM